MVETAKGTETGIAPHVERMMEEAEELGGKISRLRAFLDTSVFEELSADSQALLKAQLSSMSTYEAILGLRIRSERYR